jgi:hypothetical protein
MSKSELALKYGFGATKLQKLLNITHYEELEKVGYQKSDQILSPNVVRKFMELYGEPLEQN